MFAKYVLSNKVKNAYIIVRSMGQLLPTDGLAIRARRSTKLQKNNEIDVALTPAGKLKKAVKEYGSTVIIFHITISLISLGAFYLLVSSGFDVAAFLSKVGISDEGVTKLASNAGTFMVAYAIHKVFAPVRLGITLTATPFIVKYFRKIRAYKK